MFTESNPGQKFQIKQIHNKAEAVEGRIYYGYDDNKVIRAYRGTHEGRLKDETELISAENNIIDNTKEIENNLSLIKENTEDIEALDKKKADKCFVVGISIAL